MDSIGSASHLVHVAKVGSTGWHFHTKSADQVDLSVTVWSRYSMFATRCGQCNWANKIQTHISALDPLLKATSGLLNIGHLCDPRRRCGQPSTIDRKLTMTSLVEFVLPSLPEIRVMSECQLRWCYYWALLISWCWMEHIYLKAFDHHHLCSNCGRGALYWTEASLHPLLAQVASVKFPIPFGVNDTWQQH